VLGGTCVGLSMVAVSGAIISRGELVFEGTSTYCACMSPFYVLFPFSALDFSASLTFLYMFVRELYNHMRTTPQSEASRVRRALIKNLIVCILATVLSTSSLLSLAFINLPATTTTEGLILTPTVPGVALYFCCLAIHWTTSKAQQKSPGLVFSSVPLGALAKTSMDASTQLELSNRSPVVSAEEIAVVLERSQDSHDEGAFFVT